MKRNVAILHGAGYTGGELIRLLIGHPGLNLAAVTSRTFAGQPVGAVHPTLQGQTALAFTTEDTVPWASLDAILIAAEHGQGVHTVQRTLDVGFTGCIVDLSADFRLADAAQYPTWYRFEHPAPALLDAFTYGIPEVHAPYATSYVANPGCFATGLNLALWPLSRHLQEMEAHITACTGASGSGARPKATTHFPTRDGNMRAYKVLNHQHLGEVGQLLGTSATLHFVPVSGPWTRGIWGTAHLTLPDGISQADIDTWYAEAYASAPCVRCHPGRLPELRWSVRTPFCDVGWVASGQHLVVGFGLDNLLKGAASQAVQNLNLLLDLPETAGLLPVPLQTEEVLS